MLVVNVTFKALMFLTMIKSYLVLLLVLWIKLVKDFLKLSCRLALWPFLISCIIFFFFSSRRRHTRCSRDWSSDVCSSDLADHARIHVGEAQHRARVARFQIQDLAAARIGAQVPHQRGIAEPRGHAEGAQMSIAPREAQLDAAQRFDIVAGDGSKLDVEIEVAARLVLFRRRTGGGRLEETAAVEQLAA